MFNLTSPLRPVLKWAGGKSKSLPQLVPFFPSVFSRYFEPFVGGGAVFFSLQPGTPSVLNDRNAELIHLYEVIRDNPNELMNELLLMAAQYDEEYYYRLRDQTPESSVARAARTVFLNKTGFNGLYRQNQKGKFNVPFGKREKCPALFDKENLLLVSEHLQSTLLLSDDFERVIEMAGEGDFVYCDPPYVPLSKTASFGAYVGGGFTLEDQKRLKTVALKAVSQGARVVISNSSAEGVRDLFSDCQIQKIPVRRAINCKGEKRGWVDEVCVVL